MQKNGRWISEDSLRITDLTADGRGIGHLEEGDFKGWTVFVEEALPGDLVQVQIEQKRKTRLEGRISQLIKPSMQRRTPFCPYAEVCSGCPLMGWKSEAQRSWKAAHVEQLFERVGGFAKEEIPTVSVSFHSEQGYRNKINLRLTAQGFLGYSRRGTHEVLPIDTCVVAHPALQHLIQQWNAYAGEENWGNLVRPVRMVILRASDEETMVVLVTDPLSARERENLLRRLLPMNATVLCQAENRRPGDVRVQKPITYATPAHRMTQSLSVFGKTLSFTLSPPSFFQVNRYLTSTLYQMAIGAFTDLSQSEVLDLYCGTGTTSLLLAQRAKSVVGVEVVPEAVEDARRNAKVNHLSNVTFLAARAEDVIERIMQEEENFLFHQRLDIGRKRGKNRDCHTTPLEVKSTLSNETKNHPLRTCALVDPPRAGLDKRVRQAICHSTIQELVYISCDPATLARDAKEFRSAGFHLRSLQIVDMFANTSHVETVVLLSRN